MTGAEGGWHAAESGTCPVNAPQWLWQVELPKAIASFGLVWFGVTSGDPPGGRLEVLADKTRPMTVHQVTI